MLIRNAEIWGQGIGDVRCAEDRIAEIGSLEPQPDERVLDARGGALLPGLHDHHIHLAGLAVRQSSVMCGPPDVTSADDLARALASVPGDGWIRAIGYHESVLGGLPDAATLDRFVQDRPLRMQHRSGRMWLFNSRALDELLANAEPPEGMERNGQRFTGRLFDADDWLRTTLHSSPPDLSGVSAELARRGVTGVTDMSPSNGEEMASHFAGQVESGHLLQDIHVAGSLSLSAAPAGNWTLGTAKLHLHEAVFPPFDEAVSFIKAAHDSARGVAIHCVTEVELVFALAALEQAGPTQSDRIEHASIATEELVERIAGISLSVCVQPHFVRERGDNYLTDVEPRLQQDLYRLRTLADAGIALAGGSDAPFGSADPWQAMASAVDRTTATGQPITPDEALSPEEAISLYLADPLDLTRTREIAIGARADLCLLDRPWAVVRKHLDSAQVAAAVSSGRIIHNRVDQAPLQGFRS